MIGIEQIASYIPENRISNYDRKVKFNINDHFIEKKIGVRQVSRKGTDEDTSDMCIKSWELLKKKCVIDSESVEAIIVVTQNPDYLLPHTSAIVHGGIGFSQKCACFDVSLGCSGYVYGLSVLSSFMMSNGLKKGLLFTCDPYSKIIDRDDKNTSLLFGDAASVTLLSDNFVYSMGRFTFGTIGNRYRELICDTNVLFMNGPAIFEFATKYVPEDVRNLLKKNNLKIDQVDLFVFHQGSKFIIDTLASILSIERQKTVYDIYDYGNTVSSSIPIILEKVIENSGIKTILISGFGVGLSLAGGILKRRV